MNKWIVTTGVVAVLCMGLMAMAEPGPGGDRPQRQDGMGMGRGGERMQGRMQGMGGGAGRFAEAAGLTAEQQKALQDARYANQKKQIELKSRAELANLELQNLLQQDTPDQDAIMKAVDAVGQARTDLQKNQIEMRLKCRDIIGKEGVAKIQAGMRERGRGNVGK